MTPYERVMAVVRGETPDCVPVFAELLLQGAAELDLGLEEYFSRGEYVAEGQLRLFDKFGHDCVAGIPHVVEDISAFGARLMYFHNGPPSAGEMIIRSYDDIERLDVPDPADSPLLQETLTTIEILRQQVGGHVPILGGCIAPFSLPSMLMGTEMWMQLLFLEEEPVRDAVLPRLLDVTQQFCIRWANMQLAAGADAIVLADGMASAAVISRRQFINLALPIIQATVPQINGLVVHEGVGDLHPMLDLMVGTGVGGVMLTYRDDLTQARQMVGPDMVLLGNLNNIEMRRWTPAEMAEHALDALDQAAPHGGFILSNQGPEIPLGVSDEAIHAMVQAAHSWRY